LVKFFVVAVFKKSRRGNK